MNKTFLGFGSLLIVVSPLVAFAQSTSSQCASGAVTLCTVVSKIIGYLNQFLFLLIALAVVTFAYYVFKYFIKPNENRDEAAKYVMYSIVGFFVILSVWGLVNILQNTFGLNNNAASMSQIGNIFPTGGGSFSSGNSATNAFNYGGTSAGSNFGGTGGGTSAGTQGAYFNTNNASGGTGGTANKSGTGGGGTLNKLGNTALNNLGTAGNNALNNLSKTGTNIVKNLFGGSSNSSSGSCNGLQMPPNGNGLVYSCQNGNIVSSAANTGTGQSAGNTASQDVQACIDEGIDAATCQQEYGPGGSLTAPPPANTATQSTDIQSCIDEGIDAATCQQEYGQGGSLSTPSATTDTSGMIDTSNTNSGYTGDTGCSEYDADGNCISE